MIKTLILLSACLAGLAAAQCSYVGPSGTVDLSSVPTAVLQIDQKYMGVTSPYTWVINLCSAVNQPPKGAAACPAGPAFVSEYSTNLCETAWNTQTEAWTYDSGKGVGKTSFTNAKGWVAVVSVSCGSTLELKSSGNVNVSDQFTFSFMLTTSAACARKPPSPPAPVTNDCDVGGTTVSQLQPAVLNIAQSFNGQLQSFDWVVDLCRGTTLAPSGGASPCDNTNPAFIKEYTPKTSSANAQCLQVWDIKTGYSFANGNWSANFGSTSNQWTASVVGVCGVNPNLKAVGKVPVTGTFNNGFHFKFTFMSKAFCPSASPSPLPPAPSTNGTVTRLSCKKSGCQECSGTILPVGTCVSGGANSTASNKVVSCSNVEVTIDTWSASTTCSAFYPARATWPVNKCIEVGPSDYRFYTCSP